MKDKIIAISGKVDLLIARNNDLTSENQNLKSKIQEFQQTNEENSSKINALSAQIKELQLKSTSENDFDVETYKNKLNGLMVEIDECIAILNK